MLECLALAWKDFIRSLDGPLPWSFEWPTDMTFLVPSIKTLPARIVWLLINGPLSIVSAIPLNSVVYSSPSQISKQSLFKSLDVVWQMEVLSNATSMSLRFVGVVLAPNHLLDNSPPCDPLWLLPPLCIVLFPVQSNSCTTWDFSLVMCFVMATISELRCRDETESPLWRPTQGCAARHALVSRSLTMIHYGTTLMKCHLVSLSLVISFIISMDSENWLDRVELLPQCMLEELLPS